LIIAEKPSVAGKIANAIGRAQKKSRNQAPYYEVDTDRGLVYVAPAVGHVYSLSETKNKKWNLNYPVFDVEWDPIYDVQKGSAYTKGYINNIKSLCKEADSFVNACDYDIEGSVIGYNVLAEACGVDPKTDSVKRMHFSTVTFPDLKRAYDNLEDFDFGQTEAGLTRHKLDWFYGIKLSRALISAMRSTNARGTLSIGRVQGPALKLLVDKEREIKAFVPTPYWVISALMNKDNDFEAVHTTEKFQDEEKARLAYARVEKQDSGTVKEVNRREYKQPPPNPFDLTSLQIEVHRHHRIPPKQTLEIGQSLYENGYISYPRTSSQQLPPAICYKK
jgi:DNA topoisomerase-1